MRLKIFIITTIILLATSVFAADTCNYKGFTNTNGVAEYKWVFSEDNVDGDLNGWTLGCLSVHITGWVVGVRYIPDGTNYSDSATDLEIQDKYGGDWCFGKTASVDGTDAGDLATNYRSPITADSFSPWIQGLQLAPVLANMTDGADEGGASNDGIILLEVRVPPKDNK